MSKYQALIDALKADEYLTATVAKADIRSLLADLERAEKDAERYRWLRSQESEDFEFAVVKNPHFDVYGSGDELDAAIDAALSQLKGVQ